MEHIASITPEIVADVDRVCLLVPPLWELEAFVAVNPFLGFSSMTIDKAARVVGEALDAQVLPPMSHFRRLWREGAFGEAELDRAAQACGVERGHLESILLGQASPPMRPSERVPTRAEAVDRERGSHWESWTRELAASWCAVHAGRSRKGHPIAAGLFEGWLQDARQDLAPEIEG